MVAHDVKICTITAKHLDEEFAWEPQEFRMAQKIWKRSEKHPKSKLPRESGLRKLTSMWSQFHLYRTLRETGAEIGSDMGDRDTWSEADNDEDLEARAARNGALRVDAILAKSANEVSYDSVSEWARKVARKLAMDQRTAHGPNENGGEDESFIAFSVYMSCCPA
jgi:hypothetical protein